MVPTMKNPIIWAYVALLLIIMVLPGHAMDHGFNKESPDTKWFEKQLIPPGYLISCCGKADAYPVDRYEKLPNGDYRVWIAKGHEKPYPDGTKRTPWNTEIPIIVPSQNVNKEEDDLDNPTEFSWLFFTPADKRVDGKVVPSDQVISVYCFIRHPQGM